MQMNISGIEIDVNGNGDMDSENNYNYLNTIPETVEATASPKAAANKI